MKACSRSFPLVAALSSPIDFQLKLEVPFKSDRWKLVSFSSPIDFPLKLEVPFKSDRWKLLSFLVTHLGYFERYKV